MLYLYANFPTICHLLFFWLVTYSTFKFLLLLNDCLWYENVCWNIRNVKLKFYFFPELRLYFLMFITAVCVLFLLKLRWPKSKSIYDLLSRIVLVPGSSPSWPPENEKERTLGTRLFPDPNWNLEMLVFEGRGKPQYPKKNRLEQTQE